MQLLSEIKMEEFGTVSFSGALRPLVDDLQITKQKLWAEISLIVITFSINLYSIIMHLI